MSFLFLFSPSFFPSLSSQLSLSLFLDLSLSLSLSLHNSVSFSSVSLFSSGSLFTCLSLVGVCGCVWVCVSSCLALKNAPVCTFKTLLCVLSKRPCHMGRGRFECTHEKFLNVHTGASRRLSLPRPPSLLVSLSSCVSLFSHVSLSSHTSLSLLISLSFFSLSITLSTTMTLIARPLGSLCTHGPTLPEGQSAWALAHSLSGEHVRIMQETFVYGFLRKPRATWNKGALHLC